MDTIREPAVAGMFYPDSVAELEPMVTGFLEEASSRLEAGAVVPKAIIAPHAGYIYSGSVAASAYQRLLPARERISRVVLLGPSHRVGFHGLATSSADWFRTPLGDIPLDRSAIASLETLPQVHRLDEAHQMEHSLEVQLPFLQEVLEGFSLVPLVVGDTSGEEVAEVLEQLWGGDETLIVISSDLSHYYDYATAQDMDRRTTDAIEHLQADGIGYEGACGRTPIKGLLLAAQHHHLRARTVDLRNSGDTAGDKTRVVGYGAYLFTETADVQH